MNKRDLFVVVADLDAENAIKMLLTERQEALGISLDFSPDANDLLRYYGRDSGCYRDMENLMRTPLKTHRHAIICFDLHGSGANDKKRDSIEKDVEDRLCKIGWAEKDAAAIVIDPELEAWVWADSREVAETLGWAGNMEALRRYLASKDLWNAEQAKPFDPKKAMKQAIREKGKGGGTAPLFAKLAKKVGLGSCVDPAFNKLKNALQLWFPR